MIGFRGGRITANFGFAWYGAPGLDTTTLAEDYAIWDRMGVSGWYRLKDETFGTTTLGASTFRMDTTSLSTSWLDTRHRRTRAQGGPSNTTFQTSVALSLYGTDIPTLPGASWYVAALRQKVDFRTDSNGQREDRVADEKGVVANIQTVFFLTERLESIFIGEVAYLKNRGGVPGATGRYVTVGETLRFGQWHGQAAITTRLLEGKHQGQLGTPSWDSRRVTISPTAYRLMPCGDRPVLLIRRMSSSEYGSGICSPFKGQWHNTDDVGLIKV